MLCSWQKLGRMIVSLRKWAAMAMPMRGLKNNSRVKRHRASGFSLLEMLTVVAISIIMVAVTFVGMVPIMKQQRDRAADIVLSDFFELDLPKLDYGGAYIDRGGLSRPAE